MTFFYSRASSGSRFCWTVPNPVENAHSKPSILGITLCFQYCCPWLPMPYHQATTETQAQSHHLKIQKLQQIFTRSRTVIISELISDEIIRKWNNEKIKLRALEDSSVCSYKHEDLSSTPRMYLKKPSVLVYNPSTKETGWSPELTGQPA